MPSNEGKTHWNKQNAMWGTLLTCWKACSWLRSLGCENLLPCAAWLVQNWSHRRHLVVSSKVLCQMGWALGWSRSGEHDQGTLGRTQQEATGSWSAIQNQVLYTGISFQNSSDIAYIEGNLPKGPHLPCVSMADRALLAGYHRYVCLYHQLLYVFVCIALSLIQFGMFILYYSCSNLT